MAMKENSKVVLKYLQDNVGKDLTAADVAEALGLEKRSVDGIFTAFQKKDLGFRQEAERETEEGKHVTVKYLRLTETGATYDPSTEEK